VILIGVLALLLVFPFLDAGLGGALMQSVDDDLEFAGDMSVEPQKSRAVAVAALLMEREVDGHGWAPNDPWVMPTSRIGVDNMHNFQIGVKEALSRFAIEMSDQIGRMRGASQVDADLDLAVSGLRQDPFEWFLDWDKSFAFSDVAAKKYRSAITAFRTYNDRLARGEAVFDRRTDNLLATLERIAADLGSESASLEERVRDGGVMGIALSADDVFYGSKGKLYAYYILLRELGADFESVIRERNLEPIWDDMLGRFRDGASLNPWMVVNADPDAQFVANHLAAQGFFLLRARTRLKEITNILLK